MKFAVQLLLIAVVAASVCSCDRAVTFTYAVSPDVKPAVSSLPAANGGSSPVEAYQDEKGIRTDFVANEVVISPKSQAEMDQFLSDYGGTVIGDNSVPEPPESLRAKSRSLKDGYEATSYTVRVTKFPDTANLTQDASQRGVKGKFLFSSEAAVKLMALTSHEKVRGLRLHPNFVFVGSEMLHSTQEQPVGTGFDNAMNYFAFHGEDKSGSSKSSIYKAWQFMEAAGYVSQFWGGLAILDGGFWLNNTGGPMTSPSGIGTDLPSWIYQYDFQEDDFIADGGNPNSCSGGNPCPYHGNNSASVAAGFLNNQAAIAGSGGQVADPFLFKLRFTSDQQDRAIRTAIAWGAQVVNMSYGGSCNDDCMDYYADDDVFEHFQQAFDAGIILVAAAGNESVDVDAYNCIPCRIGGVICVGALESYKDKAISYSNFGAGVDIWADTNIPTMPNGDSLNGLASGGGTSASSPLVAGVAMMMKRINPALNSDNVKVILQNTANTMTSDPKVKPAGYMDAFRAVLSAAGNKIFDDAFEPNNTEAQATPLNPGHYEDLTLNPSQWDYYSFSLGDYGSIDFNLEYMTPMGFITFNLIPDTPGAILGGVSKGSHATGYHYGATMVPPGNYKLLLSAGRPQYYFMDFSKSQTGLLPDQFEFPPNNTLPSAKLLQKTSGSWDLTLHQTNGSDVDFIQIEMPQIWAVATKECSIVDADYPVKVELLDEVTQAVVQSQTGTELKFVFDSTSSGKGFVLKISDGYTRYVLDIRSKINVPYWEETLPYDPFVWEDPLGPDLKNILREVEDWAAFTAPPRGADHISLLAEGLGISLYNDKVEQLQAGVPMYGSQATGAAGNRKIGETLDTAALTPGTTYLLQVYRTPDPQNAEVGAVAHVKANMPYTLQSTFAR